MPPDPNGDLLSRRAAIAYGLGALALGAVPAGVLLLMGAVVAAVIVYGIAVLALAVFGPAMVRKVARWMR